AVTAVLAMVTLRPEMPWRTPETPAQVDRLDDPALLSLSDLAGDSDTDPGLGVDVVSNDQPLPELSDEELDALSQLVGGHGRELLRIALASLGLALALLAAARGQAASAAPAQARARAHLL